MRQRPIRASVRSPVGLDSFPDGPTLIIRCRRQYNDDEADRHRQCNAGRLEGPPPAEGEPPEVDLARDSFQRRATISTKSHKKRRDGRRPLFVALCVPGGHQIPLPARRAGDPPDVLTRIRRLFLFLQVGSRSESTQLRQARLPELCCDWSGLRANPVARHRLVRHFSLHAADAVASEFNSLPEGAGQCAVVVRVQSKLKPDPSGAFGLKGFTGA